MLTVFSWLMIALSISVFGLYCYTTVAGGSRENEFLDMCEYYYAFNETYGVTDPSVWLQEKRFDLERSKAMSPIQLTEPGDLDKYHLLPAPNTGMHEKWNTDNVVLGDMCEWLTKYAQYTLNVEAKEPLRKRVRAVMNDFIHRYAVAMEGKFGNVFPWGNNWYQFSITSTLMLFYFILAAPDMPTERAFAANLILKIITNPKKSLGRDREQANSVYMALPWIAAHYVKGDVYEAARDPAYEYARGYIKFQVVDKRKQEGLYLDCTYITHGSVLAYGYLSEMTRMSLPLVGLDNLMRNFLLDWRKCQRVLGHRTIKYGGIGFHARDTRLTQFTVSDSAFGIEVIPTCLFLRMYGEDYAFSMRGQVPWIAYYESDKTNNTMAQYWVQCRRVFFKDQTYTATFPDVGFIHQRYTNDTFKIEVKERCVILTKSSTTTPFLNGAPRTTHGLRAGFVFAYGSVGILRHFYYCPEMVYDLELAKKKATEKGYGRFWADEFVLCDYSKHTVDIYVKILKSKPGEYVLHGSSPIYMQGSSGIFHLSWDCKARTLKQDLKLLTSSRDEIAEYYPKGIEVVSTDNTVMLIDNGQPKMAMYPDEWLELKSNFSTRYRGKEYEFTFDSLTNQYWLAGQCIDKV